MNGLVVERFFYLESEVYRFCFITKKPILMSLFVVCVRNIFNCCDKIVWSSGLSMWSLLLWLLKLSVRSVLSLTLFFDLCLFFSLYLEQTLYSV